MIYLPAVAYSEEEVDFVRQFAASAPKLSSYWADDACSAIKSTIKHHYRVAQGSVCCYCRQIIPIKHGRVWDAEHIVPRASRPEFMFTPQNLALSCPDCNGPKSNTPTLVDPLVATYPTTGDAFLIVHPHFDDYADHIEVGNYTYAPVPGSDKGAWTIANCNLLRFAGQEFGWPEPIADERYENLVDAVFDGDPTSAQEVGERLRNGIESSDPSAP